MPTKDPSREVVSLGSSDGGDYQSRIDKAKGGSVPVGGVPLPVMPRFDQVGKASSAGVQSGGNPALLTPQQQKELAEQGRLRPGVGSGFVANQPALQNQPHEQQAAGPIRQETMQQLADVAAYNQSEASKEEEKAAKEEDDFDYDDFGNQMQDLLNNRQRRDAIDARCAPMDFSDLILHQELRQVVPIIPDRYMPTFRTLSGDEDLFLKRLISGEKEYSNQFFLDKYSSLQLCAGLYALNGQPFDTHMTMDGEIDEKRFNLKFKKMLRYPMPILADLSVNYVWFVRRVRKTMVIDAIKGF